MERSLFIVRNGNQFATEALEVALPEPNSDVQGIIARLNQELGEGKWVITKLELVVHTHTSAKGSAQAAANLITDQLIKFVGKATWVRKWFALHTESGEMSALVSMEGSFIK